MRIIESVPKMVQACRETSRPLGLVPTKGALHEGHLALVRHARQENQSVAVSIFVNPTQFGPQEDLSKYPRDLERDVDLLRQERCDLVFAPSPTAIYPPGFDTWVDVGPLGNKLEGAFRPGHFRGVATVVAKLLNITRPDRAYFGQKDGQQTVVVRQLVRDLDLGVEVVVVPTVRYTDGLALSSRNVYLTPQQRQAAPIIYQALCEANRLWRDGTTDADKLRQEVRWLLESEPLIERIDYVSVADAGTLDELNFIQGRTMVSVAVKLGTPRLIDNIILE
jgi:pantoate--beta-alanine ligase